MNDFSQLPILKALADLNRLRIVAALWHYEELCVCQITELLQVTGATVSRHLSILQHAGILTSRKDGRWIYFRLVPPSDMASVFQWLQKRCEASEPFKSDLRALKRIVEIRREELCRMQRGEECCPRS